MPNEYQILLTDTPDLEATDATTVDLSDLRLNLQWTRGNIYDRDPQGRLYAGSIRLRIENDTGDFDPNAPSVAGSLLNPRNYIGIRARNVIIERRLLRTTDWGAWVYHNDPGDLLSDSQDMDDIESGDYGITDLVTNGAGSSGRSSEPGGRGAAYASYHTNVVTVKMMTWGSSFRAIKIGSSWITSPAGDYHTTDANVGSNVMTPLFIRMSTLNNDNLPRPMPPSDFNTFYPISAQYGILINEPTRQILMHYAFGSRVWIRTRSISEPTLRIITTYGNWVNQAIGQIDSVRPQYPYTGRAITDVSAIGPAQDNQPVGTVTHSSGDLSDLVEGLSDAWVSDTLGIRHANGQFQTPPAETKRMDMLRAVAEISRGRIMERRGVYGMRMRSRAWQASGDRLTPILTLGASGVGYRNLSGLEQLDSVVTRHKTGVPNGVGNTPGTEQEAIAADSEMAYGQRDYVPSADLRLIQTVNAAITAQYVGRIVAEFREPRAFVKVSFRANVSNAGELAAINANLGDRVAVEGRIATHDYTGHYYIERMQHSVREGDQHDVEYVLQIVTRWQAAGGSGSTIVLGLGPVLGTGEIG